MLGVLYSVVSLSSLSLSLSLRPLSLCVRACPVSGLCVCMLCSDFVLLGASTSRKPIHGITCAQQRRRFCQEQTKHTNLRGRGESEACNAHSGVKYATFAVSVHGGAAFSLSSVFHLQHATGRLPSGRAVLPQGNVRSAVDWGECNAAVHDNSSDTRLGCEM